MRNTLAPFKAPRVSSRCHSRQEGGATPFRQVGKWRRCLWSQRPSNEKQKLPRPPQWNFKTPPIPGPPRAEEPGRRSRGQALGSPPPADRLGQAVGALLSCLFREGGAARLWGPCPGRGQSVGVGVTHRSLTGRLDSSLSQGLGSILFRAPLPVPAPRTAFAVSIAGTGANTAPGQAAKWPLPPVRPSVKTA